MSTKSSSFLDQAADAFAFCTLIIAFVAVYCLVCPQETVPHAERPITFAKNTLRAR